MTFLFFVLWIVDLLFKLCGWLLNEKSIVDLFEIMLDVIFRMANMDHNTTVSNINCVQNKSESWFFFL